MKTFKIPLFLRKQEKLQFVHPFYKYSQFHNTKTICLGLNNLAYFKSVASQQMLQLTQKLAYIKIFNMFAILLIDKM